MGHAALATAILVAASIAEPATAIQCSSWSQLDDAGKTATIDQMIEAKLRSGDLESYTSANRVAIRKCLGRSVSGISADFDGACRQGLEVDMEALDHIFTNYVASCLP